MRLFFNKKKKRFSIASLRIVTYSLTVVVNNRITYFNILDFASESPFLESQFDLVGLVGIRSYQLQI